MAHKTTSDHLKNFFAQHGGGDVKDWKRLSKKKNDDGEWVRQFENKKNGIRIEVVEHANGQFSARRLTDTANLAFQEQNAPLTTTPVIERDAAQNQAADDVIAMLMAPYEDEDAEDMDEIPHALLSKAGRALANRFTFAIGGTPGAGPGEGLYAEFSPTGHEYDQHLEHVISHMLPPGHGGEMLELTFDFSQFDDPAQLVSELMRRGFVWDEQYQAEMDGMTGENHHTALKQAFAAGNAGTPSAPAGQKPPRP